ncbi:bacterial dynamin-like protein [mine drainage metagenome]|uniref:Bacterial dynamin-like protein n=1 Tax=mine drainage metagenome TaxID=410659 RepID=A0A1J5R3V6_9ZZZZ
MAESGKMDLRGYAQVKFDLAEILRAAELLVPPEQSVRVEGIRDLYTKLAEDHFNLVVVGRFSRGKTSLMNALMETERLPTGIVPLTSVITTVSYGSTEQVVIEFQGRHLPLHVRLDQLEEYVTQHGNPGNARGVRFARVELPSEILRQGFHFVDTPGLGSSILENTRTTEAFLPEADALMLVTGYDSPLAEEEMRLLEEMVAVRQRIFITVNKHDTVDDNERGAVLGHLEERLSHIYGDSIPPIFSISVRQAISAKSAEARAESGIPALKAHLIRFLVEEKQVVFLTRMVERMTELLCDLPGGEREIDRLQAIRSQFLRSSMEPVTVSVVSPEGAGERISEFTDCAICKRIEEQIYEFLCHYQYDVIVRENMRKEFSEKECLCPVHAWQYQGIASSRGIGIGVHARFDYLADRLRDIAKTGEVAALLDLFSPASPFGSGDCVICRVRDDAEKAAILGLAEGMLSEVNSVPIVCMQHLPLLVAALSDMETQKRLLRAHAEAWERLSEDMCRYVLKIDGTRRALLSKEETKAGLRAIMALAGHRHAVVGGVGRVRR